MVMSCHRRVVIILEIDVIHPAEDIAGKIGDPVAYTEGKASNTLKKKIFLLKNVWSH